MITNTHDIFQHNLSGVGGANILQPLLVFYQGQEKTMTQVKGGGLFGIYSSRTKAT